MRTLTGPTFVQVTEIAALDAYYLGEGMTPRKGDQCSSTTECSMCRAKHQGGRRCKACGSYGAAAKANANRRAGRIARRKVVEYLLAAGMPETAAAVMAAPPSMLPEIMSELGIDQSVVGDKLPSTHAHPPSAAEILAIAHLEQKKFTISAEEQALLDAQDKVGALQNAHDELVQQRTAERYRRTRLRKKIEALDEDNPQAAEMLAKLQQHEQRIDELSAAIDEHKKNIVRAQAEADLAEFQVPGAGDPAERDAFLANLSSEEVSKYAKAAELLARDDVEAAVAAGTPLKAAGDRDTSVYTPGKIPMETGSGVTEIEGRFLDGGTAIARRGSGDFVVLQKKGDAYVPVGAAHSKQDALTKANRIPIVTGLQPLPDNATDLQRQLWESKNDNAIALARAAADGSLQKKHGYGPDAVDAFIGKQNQKLTADTLEAVASGPLRADINEATRRHRQRVRVAAATAAGEQARNAALAAGADSAAAKAAYDNAYRKSMGTPTLHGGIIPHFDHKIPPDSLGENKYKSVYRSGIRAFGSETANDYSIIHSRAGDLRKWGFHNHQDKLAISNIHQLIEQNTPFLQKVLPASERKAFTTYTGGSYHQINAAFTQRDGQTPSPSTKTVVDQLTAGFERFAKSNPNKTPMTLMRGTRIPSGWKGTTAEYLDSVFKVGAKMQVGKVTSCTTRPATASGFSGHPPYFMVVRTRSGIPVKSISQYSSEDEVVLPVGSNLRCVHIDHSGINNAPTVYLVEEDLVAEAQDGVGSSGYAAAA